MDFRPALLSRSLFSQLENERVVLKISKKKKKKTFQLQHSKILLMKHKTFVIKEIFIFFSICIAFCVQSMRKKYILNQQICASLKNILPQIWNSTGEILCSSRFKIYLSRKKRYLYFINTLSVDWLFIIGFVKTFSNYIQKFQ